MWCSPLASFVSSQRQKKNRRNWILLKNGAFIKQLLIPDYESTNSPLRTGSGHLSLWSIGNRTAEDFSDARIRFGGLAIPL